MAAAFLKELDGGVVGAHEGEGVEEEVGCERQRDQRHNPRADMPERCDVVDRREAHVRSQDQREGAVRKEEQEELLVVEADGVVH
eukprot:621386-Prymnesium_polylepis.1